MKHSCLYDVTAYTIFQEIIWPSRESTCMFVSPQSKLRKHSTPQKASPIKIMLHLGRNMHVVSGKFYSHQRFSLSLLSGESLREGSRTEFNLYVFR